MASISRLMGSSSSSSSIYGSRNSNIISGLASGLDTESMIEGMVESYKQKIQSLQQDRTKLQWQQNAYQSISDKLVEFSRKYASYTSTTNLFSNSFFNNAVLTSVKGEYADLVSATGKSSSDIVLNSVQQLATAARYQTSAGSLGATGTAATGDVVDLSEKMMTSNITGTLSISYNGNEKISVSFGETDDLFNSDGSLNMDKFQKALKEKLADQQLTDSSNSKVSAAEVIDVEVTPTGGVTLKTTGKAVQGASVQISGASGDLAGAIDNLDSVTGKSGSFQINMDKAKADVNGTKAQYLSGKSFSVTFNGQTKKITLGEITDTGNDAVKTAFQEALDDAFGAGRITVNTTEEKNGSSAFSFEIKSGETFSINASEAGVGEMVFGKGNSSITSYLDTRRTLGDIGAFDAQTGILSIGGMDLQGTVTKVDKADWVKQSDGTYRDKEGYTLDAEGYRVNDDGERLYEFELKINGESVGSFNQDTALETVLNSINSNTEVGVNVNYSSLTNEFVFTAKSTGAAEKIEMGDGLAKALFGDSSNYTKGTDAVFTATVNGTTQTFTRSNNTVDLDGLKVTLEGTFNEGSEMTMGELGVKGGQLSFEIGDGSSSKIDLNVTEDMTVEDVEAAFQDALDKAGLALQLQYDPATGYQLVQEDGQTVTLTANGDDAKAFLSRPATNVDGESVTFSTKTDTDTIVDAIKQMVEDYNAMVTEVKKAYSDMPLQQSNGSRYEPLTADDEEGMTESEIEAYEEKAKTGILFMDSDLSSLYNALRSAVTPGGSEGSYLRSIGIQTSYSDGLTTISLDESALREALETDLDGVRDSFTRSKENGAATDGLMTSIQNVTEKYAATTGAVKGILIEKAGSQYSPTAALDNTMLDKMESIDEQIEKWQDKMSDKVDYYTNKFTQLEMLINQMNSQSSALAGLTGGSY